MARPRRLVAGNWKMNGLLADGLALARAVAAAAGSRGCELLVCPPAIWLPPITAALAGSPVGVAGQDCHSEPSGAFTGDISAEMLRDAGCSHVIVGHSERRHGHGESDVVVRAKTQAAWRAGLVAILCVGETRPQRDAGRAVDTVAGQLAHSLPDGADAARLIVAYEPVWAIGTGLTPTASDISDMHSAIRARLPADVRVLYGGSVNPANAGEILALGEVDGALVGGASLKPEDFLAIAGHA